MPRGTPVTGPERERIRVLFRLGIRVATIAERTGLSGTVVQKSVRGIKRKRPPPPRRNRKRDVKIAWMVMIEGWQIVEVARKYGLTPTRVWQIVTRAKRERAREERWRRKRAATKGRRRGTAR